jgi:hypothetical protein
LFSFFSFLLRLPLFLKKQAKAKAALLVFSSN